MKCFIKYISSIFLLSLFGGIITYLIGSYYENQQKVDFEIEYKEFRYQWKADIKKKKEEKLHILSKLNTICTLNPHWKEYKESYLQRAENSGRDMSSKMFDEWIWSGYLSYSIIEEFIKQHYHRDSEERELLRTYSSPSLDYEECESLAFPYRLLYFDAYKESLPDRLPFIQKQKPEVSAIKVFGFIYLFLSIIGIIYFSVIKKS